MENRYMIFCLVDGVRASGVELICVMDFVRYVTREIHAFMIPIRILWIALPTPTILHTPHTRLTRMIHMEMTLNLVMIVTLSSRLTMSQNKATMKTILLIHMIHREQWAYLSTHPSKCLTSFCYDDDDDDDYNSAITPVLSTEEPVDSLNMGDEHLDTISATESDEVIKSSVEDLVPIPSESEGIPEHKCNVPFRDNSPPLDVSKEQIKDFSESNNEVSSIDDDSFSIDNIDYV
nr:hypothetical protein [Tanacetum cinerariifolium]